MKLLKSYGRVKPKLPKASVQIIPDEAPKKHEEIKKDIVEVLPVAMTARQKNQKRP